MAPVLFNLYSCLLIERWNERVRDVDGVGAYLRYKYDKKLFRRYTKNANEAEVNECQFADDAALLATTKRGAELAATEYMRVAGDFGLSLSIPKTKVMAVGRLVTEEDKQPLDVGDAEIESIEVFQYLGSQVDSSGKMTVDIDKRIAQASKALWSTQICTVVDWRPQGWFARICCDLVEIFLEGNPALRAVEEYR